MHRLEKTMYRHERDNPSFSSTLLDKIYRSIDDGDTGNGDLKFYRETMRKKQSKGRGYGGEEEDEEMPSLRQACLTGRKHVFSELDRKSDHEYEHDRDVVFFSSTSASSDSSSGGFSSSDTESMHVTKSKSSCFVTSRPKPVRTSVPVRSEKPKPVKTEKTGRTLFDDFHYSSASEYTPKLAKIYSNLKKVKPPISPGGRLAGFINSLFTTSNTKKARGTPSSIVTCNDDERKLKSGHVSTCSSASSFSRSCLSKNSPSTRERLRNGVKRSVRFCPVSVIVDEDCRPCGQKCLHQEEPSGSVSVTVPAVWKIRKSPSRKAEVMEKARLVEEMAAKFLKEYHLNQRRKDYNEDDDDAASYSSSDLFELDHLALVGNNRYREELPVYETTHVATNRAIANGLIP